MIDTQYLCGWKRIFRTAKSKLRWRVWLSGQTAKERAFAGKNIPKIQAKSKQNRNITTANSRGVSGIINAIPGIETRQAPININPIVGPDSSLTLLRERE